MNAAAISVDLDGFRAMYRTRGWTPPAGVRDLDAVFSDALPRFLDLFAELGVRATFFVIGEDAVRPEHREILRRLKREGHEIANHSMRHLHLPSLPAAEAEREVLEADEILAEVNGGPLAGFRSPAWMPTEALLDLLVRRGYRYDASVFPSPILSLWRDRSWLALPPRPKKGPDWPWVFSPREPWKIREKLWEVPAATVPIARVPVWGTLLYWLGLEPFQALTLACGLGAPVSMVLHGWELVDFDLIGDPRFLQKPGIGRPVEARRAVLRSSLAWMQRHWRLLTLDALVSERDSA